MQKAFVLLSGGMDSTTCLHKAIADCEYDPSKVEAVSIDYGQRHLKETQYAAVTCKKLGVHRVLLPCTSLASDAMLTNPDAPIPSIDYSEIKGVSPTYVPFRNGTLLAMVTAHAQKWISAQIVAMLNKPSENAKLMTDSVGIYFGAHAEDAANWAYPDTTPEFNGAMANAIYIGTYFAVRLHTPLQWLSKKEIVRLGQEFHVDWKNTWSCYAGGEKHCGVCPTCRARKTAFKQAEISDPTIYADEPMYLQDAVRTLIRYAGENPKREGLLDTPERFEKAWHFWTSGYGQDPKHVLKTFENDKHDELIFQGQLSWFSLCEHHLTPFFGMACIGYIPNGKIVGLSKLARLLDIYARRLTIQERITTCVANDLMQHLDAKGVGVVLHARHLCMESRGVSKIGTITMTSAIRGCMEEAAPRAEFFSLVTAAAIGLARP